MRYTQSEIRAAATLVKQAVIYGGVGAGTGPAKVPPLPGEKVPGVTTPMRVANPYAYNKLDDYEKWFTPASALDPPKPKRPGFWSSLGKSTLATVGAAPVPWYNREQGVHMAPTNLGYNLQSFFGLGKGRSGVRNLAEGTIGALGDYVTGNPAQGRREFAAMLPAAFSAPAMRAQEAGKPWETALSDWFTGVNKGTPAGKYYREGEYPGVVSQDLQNLLLHPIQTWRQRPPIQY